MIQWYKKCIECRWWYNKTRSNTTAAGRRENALQPYARHPHLGCGNNTRPHARPLHVVVCQVFCVVQSLIYTRLCDLCSEQKCRGRRDFRGAGGCIQARASIGDVRTIGLGTMRGPLFFLFVRRGWLVARDNGSFFGWLGGAWVLALVALWCGDGSVAKVKGLERTSKQRRVGRTFETCLCRGGQRVWTMWAHVHTR